MKGKEDIVKPIIESLEEKVNTLNTQYMKLLAVKSTDSTFNNKDVEDFLNKKVEKIDETEYELDKFRTLGSKLSETKDSVVISQIEDQIKAEWKESPNNTPKHTPKNSPKPSPKHSPCNIPKKKYR